VHNLAHSTRIEVLSYPLDSERQPITQAPASGRFMVEMEGFLEPREFPVGTAVTAQGRYARQHEGRVGGAIYRYPLLSGDRLDVWEADQAVRDPASPDVRWSIGVGIGF
jgi:outer membrane lipoprotein